MTEEHSGHNDPSAPAVHLGIAGRLAKAFIHSSLTPLLILVAILLGIGATLILPREEEPQITVPMADVMVSMPGASAAEVEQRLTMPLEKLIRELPGVEYVYSTSRPGGTLVIVRFIVGTPAEDALIRLYSKIYANLDRIPPGVSQPLIKTRSIDDVPILSLTFSSSQLSPYQLRAVAAQLDEELKQVDDVSETVLFGGQRRQLSVEFLPEKLAAHGLTPTGLAQMLGASNYRLTSGPANSSGLSKMVQAGDFFTSSRDLESLVVDVSSGPGGAKPIYLSEVARISDGPSEPTALVMHGKPGQPIQNAVTLSLAKRPGANAIVVAEAALKKLEAVRSKFVPAGVEITVTRNYGETAAERSNELLVHMMVAVVSVSLLIWVALGRRESWVVAVAIPVTLALTLTTFVFYKFTLNRVTFFALIFSIGILVDDAIVVVENVVRHMRLPENRQKGMVDIVLESVAEVGNPTILATLTVVAAILPMAFVRGLMGPYMLPIPLGASAAMVFSMLVAFTVVPWAALRILGSGNLAHHDESEDRLTLLYRRLMGALLHQRAARWTFLVFIGLMLLAAVAMIPLRLVIFKMLPFDNKSEVQVLVDMPEGTTLERTLEVLRRLSGPVEQLPEVTDYQIYAGLSAPFNFNGLVRHYFLRSSPNLGDIQINLLPKGERRRQSHAIAKDLRTRLIPIAKEYGAVVQVAEIPPGPPVLQTLVSEVYGPSEKGRTELAAQVKQRYMQTEGVVDVDWYVEDPQPLLKVQLDATKAVLNGVTNRDLADTLDLAVAGRTVGLLHLTDWREDVPVVVRLPKGPRANAEGLATVQLGRNGSLVPLSALAGASESNFGANIYHKNMQPVIYVTGDVAGRLDSPLYSILDLTLGLTQLQGPDGKAPLLYFFSQPVDASKYSIKWDGEWQVTYEVFRDLGIAFAVVLVLIYALIVGWFQNFWTPLVILSAIPFSLVGIMPAHAAMGAFFTATSMIGFIAGGGIVVRNSIILVDFIELRLGQGQPLDQAVIDAGAVRFRPMMLTAAAVVVGSAVMLTDPIFNGLAISLMAGEVASLLLSRTAVPVLYYMLWSHKHRA